MNLAANGDAAAEQTHLARWVHGVA